MTEIDHGGIERCATLHLGSCQEAVAAVAITILPNFAAAPCPPLCSQQSWLSLLSLLFYCSCHCCGCCHHSPPHLPSLPLPFCHPCRWCGCCLHSSPYLLSVPLPFRHRCCCCSCCRCCCNCLCFSCPFCRCHCCSPSCCRHNCLSGAAKKDCEFLLPVLFTLCLQTFFSIKYCHLQNMWSVKSHPTYLFRPSNATIPSHCLILNSLAKRMVSFSWEKNFCTDVNSLFFTLNCCPSSQPAIREISSHRPIFALPPQPLPCLTVS